MPDTVYRFFLGGHDLEMVSIREALQAAGLGGQVDDAGLAWGARASAYVTQIRESLRRGETPALIELIDDLPADIDRAKLIEIDHHGVRAGGNRPSSLRQVHDLTGAPVWDRRARLIAANDIGHIAGLRAEGASAKEIREIRDADRRAQGVTPDDEAAAREAIANATPHGRLLTAVSRSTRTSPLVDFLAPEYGGPGVDDICVVTPQTIEFYGDGEIIAELAATPGSWWGGALPERGFWGAPRDRVDVAAIRSRIEGWLGLAAG